MTKLAALSATLFLVVISFSASAKIWRVNNNPGVQADFTTLQAAHNGAAAGDTIHLEGSPNEYGNLTATKKLILIGPGYFLGENPGTQALNHTAKVGSVTLNAGSAGTVIMGLDFPSNNINIYVNDVLIRRNKFSSPSGATVLYSLGTINVYYHNGNSALGVNNIIISQNYGVIIAIHGASTGILISNNLIARHFYEGEGTGNHCLNVDARAIALVQNNIFRTGKVEAHNSNFTNNIMYAGSFTGTGNLVSNNISNGAQFGTANDNQANVVMTDVFVGSGSPDAMWKLKVGSPAIGAGYGSTSAIPVDCGIYSGKTPYVVAGQPNMPAIYHFENQPVGSNSDPIDVTIKVKSAGN